MLVKLKIFKCLVAIALFFFIFRCQINGRGDEYDNLIVVPNRASFGSKKIEGADRLFCGELNGKTVTINIGFDISKDSKNIAVGFDVHEGSIKIFTKSGYFKFLSMNKIAIKNSALNNEEKVFTLTGDRATFMIRCSKVYNYESRKNRVMATCRVPSVIEKEGVEYVIQRLNVIDEGGMRIVPLTIEFSNEFVGKVRDWVVPMTF